LRPKADIRTCFRSGRFVRLAAVGAIRSEGPLSALIDHVYAATTHRQSVC